MAGRECSLGARWLGIVARPPRYVARVFRGAPRSAPLRRRSFSRRVGSSPRPPCPPPWFVCRVLCVLLSVFLCVSIVCAWSVAVLGAPRSSCVLGSVAPMPHAARCAPLPASVLLLPAFGVGVRASCPSWARCARSALNGPSCALPLPLAWL